MAQIFDTFLASTSPGGFTSLFSQLCEDSFALRTYIIKSGPGCGKSSLMRRVADRLKDAGHSYELVHCSSDPLSLDGLLCEALGFALVDGTAPHVLDPAIAGAKQEVLSLYHCLDNRALRTQLDALIPLFSQNANFFSRAKRFVTAAGTLHADIERTATGCLMPEKAVRYARNLAARLLPKKSGLPGSEIERFHCAITPLGIVDYTVSNYSGCDTFYMFEDRYGAAAHLMLETLRDAALAAGCDVVTGRSFLMPDSAIESLYIPSISACFLHSSYYSMADAPTAHRVRDRRFYDVSQLSICQRRLGFCKRTVLELLDEACALMADAKLVHDDIEDIYKENVDFAAVREAERQFCLDVGLEP